MREKSDSRDKKLLIVGLLAVIAGLVALVFILNATVFKDKNDGGSGKANAKEPDNKVEVQNSGNGNDNDKTETVSAVTSEMKAVLEAETFYEGITIDGVDIAGKTKEEVKNMLSSSDPEGEQDSSKLDIKYQLGDELIPLTGVDGISLTNNLDDILEEAYNIGRVSDKSGDDALLERYEKISSLKENPVSLNTSHSIPVAKITELVHETLDPYNREPVEANVTGFDTDSLTFIIEDSADGYSVNINKAVEDTVSAIENKKYNEVINVEAEVTQPKNSAEFLRGYLCKVSSTTSTTTSSSNRNTNISLICQRINGLVLQPGESWDFNKFIGERTPEAGFKEAAGIYNGALRQEYGGGICQANAMIFHSVVKADLQVDERNPHTWPSDYVEVGTDATVTWGGANFRFTNNSEYPMAFHAYYANQKVTVEVYGRPLPDGMTIKFVGEQNSRTAARVEYTADPSLPVGKTETDRSGHDAITASSYKIYYDKDGNEIKREKAYSSSYPMITKKVRVGTLAPDGETIFKLDKSTGEVTPPKGYVPPEPTDDPNATPTVTEEPTQKPTKAPKDPTPTPTEVPEVTEKPEPTAEPTSEPEPTQDPKSWTSDPTPTPVEVPTEAPTEPTGVVPLG